MNINHHLKIQMVSGYQTCDGRVFTDKSEAERHAFKLHLEDWFKGNRIEGANDVLSLLTLLRDQGLISSFEAVIP